MFKLRKVLLVAATAMILPLALVSVGYAQELNCWNLRPTRKEENEPSEDSFQRLTCESKEPSDSSCCRQEKDQDNGNSMH